MKCVLFIALIGATSAVKLSSYENGAKFDKCIAISDFESKTLNDDITLSDRDANGCCPAGTVPGQKHYEKYVGAQVVCGFQADGSIKFSSGTSNSVKTCTYNQCYVWKQDLSCASGKQRLNGCCAADDTCKTNNCNFQTDCKNYAYANQKNVHNEAYRYCTTYHKNYKMEYTQDKTDDQSGDKLHYDKLYVYTPCTGSGTGTGTGSGNVDADGSVIQTLSLLIPAVSILGMIA